jgi:hypothetical protein
MVCIDIVKLVARFCSIIIYGQHMRTGDNHHSIVPQLLMIIGRGIPLRVSGLDFPCQNPYLFSQISLQVNIVDKIW